MIDYTENLYNTLRDADDFSIVCEIYAADAVPDAAVGFDPNDALKRFSSVDEDLEFFGATYTRLIRKFGNVKRTIDAETNSAAVDYSNLSREISEFEFGIGFEGLIKAVRLISRSNNNLLSDSLILFAGVCEKPTSGSRELLSVKAKQIVGSLDVEVPRRKFVPEDAEGRAPSDVLFEGFRFVPQYGVTPYSARDKRGGLLGLFGLKKTVTKNLSYSSFSDLDVDKFLPLAFGRVQVIGTHLAYVDVGTAIDMTTAFLEGKIEDFTNVRSIDPRYFINPANNILERYGDLGGVGTQFPHPTSGWPGNGYYSKTALIFSRSENTSVAVVDPAPDLAAVALALIIPVPNLVSGIWEDLRWSDDAAAQTRFLLTDPNYHNLDEAWIDDTSFLESYNYNTEFIFDTSFADIIFTPATPEFNGAESEGLKPYFLSTGRVSREYFQYLAGDATAAETFFQPPVTYPYDTNAPSYLPEPCDPLDEDCDPGGGGGGGGGGTTTSFLNFALRRRYTSNVVITEQQKLTDFLHNVLFVSSRLFLSQNSRGQIKINNKKPVNWALATTAIALNAGTISVDDASKWVSDKSGSLLIDPNTAESEVREVTDAVYPTAQNSTTLTASANITVAGFSGANGASQAATATLTVASVIEACSFTLDGIATSFVADVAIDTVQNIAGFIYATINAHPQLNRKFVAAWTPGTAVVTITAKFGTLTLSGITEFAHSAPVANPTTAPVLAAIGGGTFKAGNYLVAYSYKNGRGETFLSPSASVTLTANQKISVSAITPPVGTEVSWYVSPAENAYILRFHSTNSGAAFVVDTLPKLTAPIRAYVNRTGAEVLRVSLCFSDRAESRSNTSRSNVLKATYEWILGNREKSVNRIDLKYRDATQDWRLVELRLRNDEHIAKTKKVSNLQINGQAIDNHNQAYRIASGLLAELRDADFFYKWSSDRLALLLEEGDVVCITDDGAQIYNLAVRIEEINFTLEGGFPKASFTARKYSTTLYDDGVSERAIPIIIQSDEPLNFVEPGSYEGYDPEPDLPATTTIAKGDGAGTGIDATATLEGSDNSGVITVNTDAPAQAVIATVFFASELEFAPRVVITPTSDTSNIIFPYVVSYTDKFEVFGNVPLADGAEYNWNYIVKKSGAA